MTNYKRIKGMSLEELAREFWQFSGGCEFCPNWLLCQSVAKHADCIPNDKSICEQTFAIWLFQESNTPVEQIVEEFERDIADD